MTESTLPISQEMKTILSNHTELAPRKKELVSEEVDRIRNDLDIKSTAIIEKFGDTPRASLTEFTDRVLAQATQQDLEQEMEMLGNIVTEMEGLRVDQNAVGNWLSKLPIIGDVVGYSMRKFELSFQGVNERIELITTQLEAKNNEMDKAISELDEFYTENKNLIHNLDNYIRAGEEAMQSFIQNEYSALRAEADATKDQLDIQKVNDAEGQMARFHKRLTNLDILRTKAINSLPISRTLQENYLQIKDDFKEIIFSVVPMWKNQFILTLNANKQKKLITISGDIKDRTNQQELAFADNMVQIQKDLNDQLGRGILDKETLIRASDATIEVIKLRKERVSSMYNQQLDTRKTIQETQEQLKSALTEGSELGDGIA